MYSSLYNLKKLRVINQLYFKYLARINGAKFQGNSTLPKHLNNYLALYQRELGLFKRGRL